MKLIATHNSGTGEKSKGLLSILTCIFSRCQFYTLEEQYLQGVRLFDLRIKKINGVYYIAHGLWESIPFKQALKTLSNLGKQYGDSPYILITYEGELNSQKDKDDFVKEAHNMVLFKNLRLVTINCKLPKWETLKVFKNLIYKQDYAKIVGWKCLLPIPYLWWLFRKNPEFNSSEFTMVDFYLK